MVVDITNNWPNRLIGDEEKPAENEYSDDEPIYKGAIVQLPQWYRDGKPKPDDGRQTFAAWKHFDADSPLIESGLLGPVKIIVTQQKDVSVEK
mgnify:CR=1 FL=1